MDPGSAVVAALADVSLRSLGVAAAAWAAIGLLRIRGAAGRHAVWTLATAAMLPMAVLRPALPPLTLRVLRPAAVKPVEIVTTAVTPLADARGSDPSHDREGVVPAAAAAAPAPAPPPAAPFDWRQAVAAVYAAGVLVFAALLAASYDFTRRLARTSRKVECQGADDVFESNWIAVPMTVGLVHPRIILPPEWRKWPVDKLAAALVHERMHVRRADWAVAALAGLNRCVFWFHPLAWWLGRRLAALAEQACDDAALLSLGERECYARTLLDMTAAVASGRGRMVWEAMAMARTAEVRKRIERILDETREIPRGWTRARWMAVAACSIPLFYAAAAVRVTEAQEAPAATAAVPQAQAQRVDVPGTDMERRLRKKVEPEYPPIAVKTGVQGDVILETVIGANGHVKSARPVSGNPLLAGAAQEAVLKYEYIPAGAEIGSTATVVFRLPAGAGDSPRMQDAILIYRKAPEPGAAAVAAGASGPVQVQFTIGKDGVPSGIRVTASPSPLLGQAAIEAVGHWRYKPATMNGVPVESESAATVNFAPPSAPVVAASEPAKGAVTPAVLVYRKEPEYPEMARQMGQRGIVELDATIGVDGRVKSVKVVKGPPMLQRAAREAVMQWVYMPAVQDGVTVECEIPVTLTFGGAAEAPVPGREASSIGQAVLVYKKDPEYPKEAQQMGQRGVVELDATIGVDGRVKDAKVVSGPPMLQKPARDAVMQWIYKPTAVNGVAVENQTHIAIDFDARWVDSERSGGKTAAPAPEASSAPVPKSAASSISRAVLVYKKDPEYPKMARAMGQRGVVELDVTIGVDGRVKDAKVVKGPPMLQKAAQEAVMQWIYKPPVLNGVPVEYPTHVAIEFAPAKTAAPERGGGETATPAPASERPHDSLPQAVLVYKKDPEYPKAAQLAGERGVVELDATIGVDGRVKGVKVVKGLPLLQEEAQKAVMQWVYKPTVVDGVPVENHTHISIEFQPNNFR